MVPETGFALLDWFLALLGAWGYVIVFGFTIFENLFVVGSFTPGETVVIAASFVASNGGLTVALVWLASVLGTVTGSNLSYVLGRRAGMETVYTFAERIAATRIGRVLRIDPGGLDDVREHFETDGAKTVFFARFAIGAKNFVPAVAGAVRMPLFWFEFHTVLGAMTYSAIMCAIGWFLGANLDLALRVASGMSWGMFVLLVIFFGALWAGRRRAKARKQAAAHEPPERVSP